jgi:endo-1,4-beta-mannosidase
MLLAVLLIVLAGLGYIYYRQKNGPIFYVMTSPFAPPLPTCTEAEIQAATLPTYTLTDMTDFARLQDGQFFVGDERYQMRGVNYFPVRYPWRRFLTESDLTAINNEFALLRDAGLNTIRTFLFYEPMFQCAGSGAVPKVDPFMRLDGLIHAAAANGIRIILTLNDTPDFVNYPLYTNPAHTQAQTQFIVERYRDEVAILAWDIRNEGDIDYSIDRGRFPRQQVLDWVAVATAHVRSLDSNHLITAGWMTDAESTAPYVDFISFHHWWSVENLQERIEGMRKATDKPILLEEFGYSTLRVSEDEQARLIYDGIVTAEAEGLLGWMVWTAFDFPVESTCMPPHCPDIENAEHNFGIWYADYTPKPAAGVVISLFGGDG